MPDICPPHDFKAAWITENVGAIFCRLCGEIRELTPPAIEAPAEEKVDAKAHDGG